jgi:hypothetical protein
MTTSPDLAQAVLTAAPRPPTTERRARAQLREPDASTREPAADDQLLDSAGPARRAPALEVRDGDALRDRTMTKATDMLPLSSMTSAA